MSDRACRFCGAGLEHVMADLGVSPLANHFLTSSDLDRPELFYPLKVFVCSSCHLAQLEEFESPEHIFSDYAYFSSVSKSWLEHSSTFADAMIERLGLDHRSLVTEVASNDGYLLQYFRDRGVEVRGIEPAVNVAGVANERGVPTDVAFFGSELARTIAAERRPDLLVANNVLAHVPDLNDFVAGLSIALAPEGMLVVEFPHLLRLIEDRQFDTIYHEHFSYFSLHTARHVFDRHGIRIIDVDILPTHGGSLRIYGVHTRRAMTEHTRVQEVIDREVAAGLTDVATFSQFADTVRREKRTITGKLIQLKGSGNRIVGYGAPAKGNTLFNYCGIGTDLIDFTVDASPSKQNMYLPGSRIPVLAPDAIDSARPDLIFILPWNIKTEIMTQLDHVRAWGGRFLVRTPDLEVIA